MNRHITTCLDDDDEVFCRFASNVDELYATLDNSFWEAKMHEIDVPGRTSTVTCTGPNAWEIRMRDANMLPFDFQRTQQAVWDFQTARTSSKVEFMQPVISFTASATDSCLSTARTLMKLE